ncbi:helix-turn-helix domain-containing protein [Sorangium sp. So ce1128]
MDAGATPACIAQELQVARSTISRVRSRFLADGLVGLRDHRAHNGNRLGPGRGHIAVDNLLSAHTTDELMERFEEHAVPSARRTSSATRSTPPNRSGGPTARPHGRPSLARLP